VREKNRSNNCKKFLFLGFILGLPLQQQQEQHWNNQVRILNKTVKFYDKIKIKEFYVKMRKNAQGTMRGATAIKYPYT